MAKVTTTALPEGVELSIAIYVTSETDSPASLSVTDTKASPQLSDLEKEMDDEKSHSGSIKVVEGFLKGATTVVGKPDLHHILEDAVTNSTGPVSVDGESHRFWSRDFSLTILSRSVWSSDDGVLYSYYPLWLIRFAYGGAEGYTHG